MRRWPSRTSVLTGAAIGRIGELVDFTTVGYVGTAMEVTILAAGNSAYPVEALRVRVVIRATGPALAAIRRVQLGIPANVCAT